MIDDPVAGYDAVASSFGQLTEGRRAYLDAIDRLVRANIPVGARRLLDIGAGDARRARAMGLAEVVLIEPSAGMRRASESQVGYRDLRAEQLDQVAGPFDVIICLWNVLGHVFPHAARVEVLRQCGRLLAPGGRLFIDVNHRYNAAQYGWLRTAGRYLYDLLRPSERNGDVVATWRLGARQASVRGHVFTDREFRRLARDAGLEVERRVIVDYSTGAARALAALGNPFFFLIKSDSPNSTVRSTSTMRSAE